MSNELPLAALAAREPNPAVERVERTDRADRVERVQRAAAGDRVAFEELVHEHWHELVRLARVVLAGDLEAEDVAQEALIDAWRHLGALRDPERFAVWLRRALVRRALRRLGRRRTEPLEAGAEPAAAERGPELVLDVERLLGLLPPRSRAAFFLTEIEGASDAEAARKLGISAVTVRVHRFLVRRRLRALLLGESR